MTLNLLSGNENLCSLSLVTQMADTTRKRKPSPPGIYSAKPRTHPSKKEKGSAAPRTSAVALKTNKENLTLHDWLTIREYFNTHQLISQQAVVTYFATRPEGALFFSQGSLSHHLLWRVS